jgi:hypothetical protein
MATLTIFERLGQKGPSPAPTEPAREDQTTMLLEWLVRFWTRPSITLRDFHRSAPHSLRDKETILDLTQNLAKRGWLIPQETRRRDKREWKIARGLPPGK